MLSRLGQFFKLSMVENPTFAVLSFDPVCHSSKDINISSFGSHMASASY